MLVLSIDEACSPNSGWPLRLDKMERKSKSFGYLVVSVRG